MARTAESSSADLSPLERTALELGRFTNERAIPKRFQYEFIRLVTHRWVRRAVGPRVYADGLEPLLDREPDRGVVFAANHRSFFDQWMNMLCMYEARARWVKRFFFPVRSNFFYETAAGMLVNYLLGMGAMYPPIFRDRKKAALNRQALERIIQFLQEPGTIVGLHPEGTRGKGPDPYDLLPAQPGIGEIVLKARPIVLPIFIGGLSNSFVSEIAMAQRPSGRRSQPIILVYGPPVDLSEFDELKPRAALYKKCSDRILEAIRSLIPREQELRAACARGDIGDDHPGWLMNLGAARAG